jgi:uncharacterized protein YqhQ
MEHIGGQAVIEGVMMRSPTKLAVSVRLPNGKIKTKKENLKKFGKFYKMPFIRGGFVLIDTLVKGMKTLIWSADQQLGQEEKITTKEVVWALLFSVVLAIVFFIIVPFVVTQLIFTRGILFNIVDGILRLVMFILYVLAISLMKDVKVLFQYHGAEHKAVNCFEHGLKLTLENAKKFSTLHRRCGTSFIFIVLLVSIVVFSALTSQYWYVNLLARILLIPVIAAISYEILKLGDRFKDNWFLGWLSLPGMWIQRITTKEPTNKQIEVAIVSLKKVL